MRVLQGKVVAREGLSLAELTDVFQHVRPLNITFTSSSVMLEAPREVGEAVVVGWLWKRAGKCYPLAARCLFPRLGCAVHADAVAA